MSQYYVEGNHEAIIDPETFDYVQAKMARRINDKQRYRDVNMFSSKIRCGKCGCWYEAKARHSTDKYCRVIYQCNHKYKGEKPYGTPHITEDEVREGSSARSTLSLRRGTNSSPTSEPLLPRSTVQQNWKKRQMELHEELEVVVELTERCVVENARIALDQDEYAKRYNKLAKRYGKARAEFNHVTQAIADKEARKKLMEQFIRTIEKQELITKFDERLWTSLVDFVTGYSETDVRVTFKGGTEIKR